MAGRGGKRAPHALPTGTALPLPPPPEQLLATRLTACLQYGAVSTAITLFNRAVFSVYNFNFPATVTLLQILVSVVLMAALGAAGRMHFTAPTLAGARRAAPLALFWWLYVVSGVTALRYLNVPMYRWAVLRALGAHGA